MNIRNRGKFIKHIESLDFYKNLYKNDLQEQWPRNV